MLPGTPDVLERVCGVGERRPCFPHDLRRRGTPRAPVGVGHETPAGDERGTAGTPCFPWQPLGLLHDERRGDGSSNGGAAPKVRFYFFFFRGGGVVLVFLFGNSSLFFPFFFFLIFPLLCVFRQFPVSFYKLSCLFSF